MKHISAPFNPQGGLDSIILRFMVLGSWFYEDAPSLASEPIWSSPKFSYNLIAAYFIPSAASRKPSPIKAQCEKCILYGVLHCSSWKHINIPYTIHTHTTHYIHSTHTQIPLCCTCTHAHVHPPYIPHTLYLHIPHIPIHITHSKHTYHIYMSIPYIYHIPHTHKHTHPIYIPYTQTWYHTPPSLSSAWAKTVPQDSRHWCTTYIRLPKCIKPHLTKIISQHKI